MSRKSLFHTQTLKAWAEINIFVPKTLKEIINQNVCQNIYLQIDNNPIKYAFLGIKNKIKLQKMKLYDLIKHNWKIVTTHSLEQTLDEKISILKYMSLVRAIPQKWKDKIKKDNHPEIHMLIITDKPQIKIRNKFKNLGEVTSKKIHTNLI